MSFGKVMKENMNRVAPNESINPIKMDMSTDEMFPNKAGLEKFSFVKTDPQPPEEYCIPVHPREKRAVITETYTFPFF